MKNPERVAELLVELRALAETPLEVAIVDRCEKDLTAPSAIKNVSEHWRKIKCHEDYQISNLGRVKSSKSGEPRDLKHHVDPRGYLVVTFHENGNPKSLRIHRLVAEAFIPNPENKPQVNHINGDKTDNRVVNLEWVTPSENIQHSLQKNLRPQGGDVPNSKLTNEQATWCRSVYIPRDKNFGARALARFFCVSLSVISKILHGETYKMAEGKRYASKQQPNSLPSDVCEEIRRIFVKGDKKFGTRALARKFGVSHTTIQKIVRGD